MAAGKIFLCYRREDSAGHAGRLYDRLNQRFPGRVFMDVAGIDIGARWAEVIEQTLGACEVAVILIGRRWLERGPDGTRRIDDPNDPLRAEITTALRHKLKIVPLLIAGAAVPQREDLPQDVAAVVDWQALRIDDDEFDQDASQLIKALERQLEDEGTDPRLESADAKNAEIGRLLTTAESCIARADWITAAQILRSALSLDTTHAEAAARLRFVQQQSTRAYALPPQGRARRRAPLGAAGLLGAIGAAAVAVTLIVLLVPAGEEPASNVMPAFDPAAATLRTASEAPAVPEMAGEYELTSYTAQGTPIPATGTMRLVPIGDGRFEFDMSVTNPTGATFQYRGHFEGHGADWTTRTVESDDPTAVKDPIPTQVTFDGSTLRTHNPYGYSVAWQKRRDEPR